MVGAMILARASDDPALSDEVLDQTRVWLEAKTKDRRQHNSRNRSTKDCRLTKGVISRWIALQVGAATVFSRETDLFKCSTSKR